MKTIGSSECPCVDVSSTLAPFQDCKTSLGFPGLHGVHRHDAACYPLNYGSRVCRDHDNDIDPLCKGKKAPDYCHESWCFVDADKCKMSKEKYFRSAFDEVDLFYSYSTCNSSEIPWTDFTTTKALKNRSTIKATIPEVFHPHHYKFTENNSIAEWGGPEYYNTSIPFRGALIDYIEQVVQFSDDIDKIDYQFRSKGSDIEFPSSAFTASVRDVQYGLTDLAIGPFWITSERLRMVAFTSPFRMDRTLLVVKQPEVKDSLVYQVQKTMDPFTNELWCLLVLTIWIVGALSIWFASPRASNRAPWIAFRNDEWRESSNFRRMYICYRQILDSALQRGVNFFGASVDYDYEASISYKILMFGFSFLILITVAAYTANLAAVLTRKGVVPFIQSMEAAIDHKVKICAHEVVRAHLEGTWPDAHFVFNYEKPGMQGMLENYDAGKCKAMAVGLTDNRYDRDTMNKLCDRGLVFTNALVIELPMAFPVNSELASGISHWIFEANKDLGLTFDKFYGKYEPELKCSVELVQDFSTGKAIPALTINNMAFPFIILALCAVVAIAKKLCDRRNTLKAAQMISRLANLDQEKAQIIVDMAKFAHLDIHDVEKYDASKYDTSEQSENAQSASEGSGGRIMPLHKGFHKRNEGNVAPRWRSRCGNDNDNEKEEMRRIRESIIGALNPHLHTRQYATNEQLSNNRRMNFGRSICLTETLNNKNNPPPFMPEAIPESSTVEHKASTLNLDERLQNSKSNFGKSIYLTETLCTTNSDDGPPPFMQDSIPGLSQTGFSDRFTFNDSFQSYSTTNSGSRSIARQASPTISFTKEQLKEVFENAVVGGPVKSMIESAIEQSVSKVMKQN